MANNTNFSFDKATEMLRRLDLNAQLKKLRRHDVSAVTAFIGAIAVLLFVAGYVVMRLESDRAYRAKWRDYNDCGWA